MEQRQGACAFPASTITARIYRAAHSAARPSSVIERPGPQSTKVLSFLTPDSRNPVFPAPSFQRQPIEQTLCSYHTGISRHFRVGDYSRYQSTTESKKDKQTQERFQSSFSEASFPTRCFFSPPQWHGFNPLLARHPFRQYPLFLHINQSVAKGKIQTPTYPQVR